MNNKNKVYFFILLITLTLAASSLLARPNKQKAIDEVFFDIVDTVYKIETSKDGSRIFMRNEGAVFYLKKGTKKYSSIHRALGESHKFSKSIKLKVNAKSLVIVSYED